eukprot:14774343-Alexandrium_andersonii.AAC.1
MPRPPAGSEALPELRPNGIPTRCDRCAKAFSPMLRCPVGGSCRSARTSLASKARKGRFPAVRPTSSL